MEESALCLTFPHCHFSFNEIIELPLPYDSLYDYNGICFILTSTCTDEKGVHEQLLAGANMPLYNSRKLFRHGIYELELHPLESLGVYRLDEVEKVVRKVEFNAKPLGMDQLNKLLKTSRKHVRSELLETPLDRYARSDAELAIENAKRDSGRLFLSVEFQFSRNHPNLSIPVLFERREIDPITSDARSERWNPVDEKYFKMTRSLRIADFDRKRKPNKETLDRLKDILDQPPSRDLPESDGDLVWQYRFYLSEKYPEAALAKFLLAVRWEYPEQVDQAVALLLQWPSVAPEHVLELLNRHFIHPAVRRFAVARLDASKNAEILLYLYQLVQALHYENWHDIFSVGVKHIVVPGEPLELSNELEYPHQVQTPTETPSAQRLISFTEPILDDMVQNTEASSCPDPPLPPQPPASQLTIDGGGRCIEALKNVWKEDLATFLLRRALSDWSISNYLYWFLRLEANKTPSSSSEMYAHILRRLQDVLTHGTDTQQLWYRELVRQTKFVDDLLRLLQAVTDDSGNRIRKIELLRTFLCSEDYSCLTRLDEPLCLPVSPDVKICGIDPSSSSLFKSSRRPAFLSFLLPDGERYNVIFKHGDDLRRDQLVLQMIALMDTILRKENFDLRLTPYKVLVTGNSHGFVQFIESTSIQDILQQGTLLSFLQQNAPSTTDPLGVQKEVMETYIRSCAGYCVITYLLGVGDRHMENLLLTNDGRLFHIDFSFIFGNDPKPMATEVRLTRSMIEAMGGANTNQFSEFWKITFTAFLVLRRHANLFLTLFSLVSNMDVRTTARDQSSACEFLKERFCINQTEERAVNRLTNRMTESIKAIVPDIMERIHSLMQYMRP
ncbi:unnamed protein product [Dicrocoelium dendriticum]|nr:unnamed protein product [Dicrocoelium dendriticum]